ncbi:hypothetical protein [Cohnella candidum]|nr:hypothetical protein [Cohnella candidum]
MEIHEADPSPETASLEPEELPESETNEDRDHLHIEWAGYI